MQLVVLTSILLVFSLVLVGGNAFWQCGSRKQIFCVLWGSLRRN